MAKTKKSGPDEGFVSTRRAKGGEAADDTEGHVLKTAKAADDVVARATKKTVKAVDDVEGHLKTKK